MKEILIQYEELYLDSGDGMLLGLFMVRETSTRFSTVPKLLAPNGDARFFHIPECYKLYCSNDFEYLNNKFLLNTAKTLYFLISYRQKCPTAYKIKEFKINLTSIKLFFGIPFKPQIIRKYHWYGFYIEN